MLPTNEFCAEYYNDKTLSGNPVLVRTDRYLNFEWGPSGGPGGGVGTDNFSVRWQGKFNIPAGNYVFRVRHDDGIRVWLRGEKIIDRWNVWGDFTTPSRSLAGGVYTIMVEYYEAVNAAHALLTWGAPTCNPNPDQIALFEHAQYRGSCQLKDIGQYPKPGAIGLAYKSVSSLKVGNNVRAILCEKVNYGTPCYTFLVDDPNLAVGAPLIDGLTYSVKVERRPPTTLRIEAAVRDLTVSYDASTGNTSFVPLHPTIAASVEVQKSGGTPFALPGQVTYDPARFAYVGTVTLPTNATAGSYTVRVKFRDRVRTLKHVAGTVPIQIGVNNLAPRVVLLVGDVNDNDVLDDDDYNRLQDCYDEFGPPRNCSDPEKKKAADLTDDDRVTLYDYNILLRAKQYDNDHPRGAAAQSRAAATKAPTAKPAADEETMLTSAGATGARETATRGGADGSARLRAASPSATPGTRVALSGEGFAPGSTITLSWDGRDRPLAAATAGPNGRFSATITVPAHARLGTHVIVARDGRGKSGRVPFEVLR